MIIVKYENQSVNLDNIVSFKIKEYKGLGECVLHFWSDCGTVEVKGTKEDCQRMYDFLINELEDMENITTLAEAFNLGVASGATMVARPNKIIDLAEAL